MTLFRNNLRRKCYCRKLSPEGKCWQVWKVEKRELTHVLVKNKQKNNMRSCSLLWFGTNFFDKNTKVNGPNKLWLKCRITETLLHSSCLWFCYHPSRFVIELDINFLIFRRFAGWNNLLVFLFPIRIMSRRSSLH